MDTFEIWMSDDQVNFGGHLAGVAAGFVGSVSSYMYTYLKT
jgi:hypothetical protein